MKYCRKENIRKNILGKVSISNSFFSRILSSLIRPLNFTQNDLCATSDNDEFQYLEKYTM